MNDGEPMRVEGEFQREDTVADDDVANPRNVVQDECEFCPPKTILYGSMWKCARCGRTGLVLPEMRPRT